MAWIVGVNAPGYMPDEEPQVCPDWTDAILTLHKALVDTQNALHEDDEDHGLEDAALSVDAHLREFPVPQSFHVMLCGLVHFVNADD